MSTKSNDIDFRAATKEVDAKLARKPNDGGPVFPYTREMRDSTGQLCGTETIPGMSLRAWLAGMAMQGECASSTEEFHYENVKAMAKACVKNADALIAELEKEKE